MTVGANVAGRSLDDEAFWPVYEELNRFRLPVLIHPMVPERAEMLEDFFLISAVGFMFDTTAAVARLLFKGVLERFPDLPSVIPHMGAIVPYLAGRWAASHARGGPYDALPHPPSYYLSASFMIVWASNRLASAVRKMWWAAGDFVSERAIPSTNSMTPPIQLLENMDWARDAKEGVFHQNARKIFPKIP